MKRNEHEMLWSLNKCLTSRGVYTCAIDTLLDLYLHIYGDLSEDLNSIEDLGKVLKSLGKVLKSLNERKMIVKDRKEWSDLRQELWNFACLNYPR